MSKRIDVGNGRVWARCKQLAPELGRWVEMPAHYDSAAVSEEDLTFDCALRRLTSSEAERAEASS